MFHCHVSFQGGNRREFYQSITGVASIQSLNPCRLGKSRFDFSGIDSMWFSVIDSRLNTCFLPQVIDHSSWWFRNPARKPPDMYKTLLNNCSFSISSGEVCLVKSTNSVRKVPWVTRRCGRWVCHSWFYGKCDVNFIENINHSYTTWKADGATPISLGLFWPLTNRHLLGVASHLLSLRCMKPWTYPPKKKFSKSSPGYPYLQ